MIPNTYFIQTFGCQANLADSERLASYMQAQGLKPSKSINTASQVIINTCMVRQMAEDRVYGLYKNLVDQKSQTGKPQKIIITGCMVGAALRDPQGHKFLDQIRKKMPQVDEFLPIEEIGFDQIPLRTDSQHAWVPISNGCNNFCTFCVVPFSRGREVSRPFEDIIAECHHLADHGYKSITLIGQNVNSYGADLILGPDNIQMIRDLKTNENPTPPSPLVEGRASPRFSKEGVRGSYKNNRKLKTDNRQLIANYQLPSGRTIRPTPVKHLGKYRIPTLFPQLLETICQQFPQFSHIDFLSSNPWDFSNDLIKTIAKYPQISRTIHLPVQSGSDKILKKMNRWYTAKQYLQLINKIQQALPDIQFTTDIIVGFPGETEPDFQNTLQLIKQVKFTKAYISRYSPRPHTAANLAFPDDIPHTVKKSRWNILNNLINH